MNANPLRSLLLASVALAVVLLSSANSVGAHAALEGSNPAANSAVEEQPSQVELWFTEPMAPDFSSIEVLNEAGERVDNGDSAVDASDPKRLTVSLPPLGPGTYTVAWKNLSTVDGHPRSGAFVFFFRVEPSAAAARTVTPDPPVLQSPADPIARWLVLVAALAAAGVPLLGLLIPRLATPTMQDVSGRVIVRQRLRRLTLLALASLLVASLIQLIVQASIAAGGLIEALGDPLLRVLVDTRWGHAWLARVAFASASLAALFISLKMPNGDTTRTSLRRSSLLLAWAALGSLAFASHAAATPEVARTAVVADLMHLFASAAWVGGLFGFLLTLHTVRHALPDDGERRLLAGLVPRFSLLAAVSTLVLVVTGIYASWVQVTVLRAFDTPYGWTLIAKLVLFGGLVVLGAVNLMRVRPALREQVRARRFLAWMVRTEVVLGVLVLLAVGLMTSMEPARQTQARADGSAGIRFEAQDGTTEVRVRIEPGVVGVNRAVIEVRDERGDPVSNASRVGLYLTYLDEEFGTETFEAVNANDGTYVVESILPSVAGVWQAEVTVERPGAFDARVADRFELGPTPGASSTIEVSEGRGWQLATFGMGILGTGFLAIAWLAKRDRRLPREAVNAAGYGALIVAFFMFTSSPGGAIEDGARNPIPPSAGSVALGEEVYRANCASCHGPSGRGDGPAGEGLTPPPADLWIHVPQHTDQDLFGIVSEGVAGTAMPGFEQTLTEEQRWNLLNYLRTLAAEGTDDGG